MKKFLWLPLLLIAGLAQAADVGYYNRPDCGTLSPVANRTVCLQSTTINGRTAGSLYIYTGSWTELTPGGGDITGVTAGDGLAGGGTTGAVTLTLADCAANQILKRNAGDTAWECAADADSGGGAGGDITEVQANGPLAVTSGTGPIPVLDINQSVNAQTGTTYTYVDGDKGKLVTHSNAAAIAATLPNAAGAGFDAGWFMDVRNLGTGLVTITPTTSTIDGLTTVRLPRGQSLKIVSDGTNYFTFRGAEPNEIISVDRFGADPTGGSDSTTAIQAALDSASRASGSYNLGSAGLPSGMDTGIGGQTPMQCVHFSAGGRYVVSTKLTIPSTWWGCVNGNGAEIIWNGADSSQPVFYLHNVRMFQMENLKIWTHTGKPANAAVTMDREASGITPTHTVFKNINVYGWGGLKYGFRNALGTYDGNGDFVLYDTTAVFDYTETAYSIEHSQAKAIMFINAQFNGGSTGKRGVALMTPEAAPTGNGSFYWYGGGGGGNSVCDFQLAGPLENVFIDGGKYEASTRLLCSPFYEVISGLVGSVPAPASLTMDTPAGSAYEVGTATVLTNAGYTHTFTASKDTYVTIGAAGAITYNEYANGAAFFNPSGGTLTQKVVTDGTQITSVTALGGSFGGNSTNISPVTVRNVGWSSGNEPWDGNFIHWGQLGPLTLIGNRFRTNTTYGNVAIYGGGATTSQAAGKLTMIGNSWYTNLSPPYPALSSRIRLDRSDMSIVEAGVGTGRYRVIAMGEAMASSSDELDTVMPKFEILGNMEINDRWVKENSAVTQGLASAILTGTIDPAASTTVTGVGTKFTTELVVGDRITVTGETRTVSAIASDTSLTVTSAFSNNANDTSPDRLSAIHVWKDSSGTNKMVLDDLGNLNLPALTASRPVILDSSKNVTTGTYSGNTTAIVTTTGTQTSGDCVKIDANGNHIANGSACGGAGDIEGVTAGDGLAGGGTSGTVTLTIMDCAANQILKRNAGDTAWECATDSTGGTPSFDAITGGTNTTAAMVVGTGGSLAVSGSGTIAATTAAALAANGSNCSAGQAAGGVSAAGVAEDCTAYLQSVTAHNVLSATHGDSTAASATRGDIITAQGASPLWTRLAKGTQYQLLTGGANEPAWGAVALDQATAISGILGSANGGTGNGFTKFSGPTTSEKTFTLPDASASLAILGANSFTGAQTITSAAPQIILGVNVTTLGSIKMFGNTSGDVTISPRAAAGTAVALTFPDASGAIPVGPAAGPITFTGPTAARSYALPDSAATILYSGGALGTPASGTLTNATGLPIAGLAASTSTAIGVGSVELGHATDTTIARVSAGVASIEGNNVLTTASTTLKSVYFPAGALSTDGTNCAAPAEVTINSGSKRWTIICTDNDLSTIYGEVELPDSASGTTFTLMGSFIQTAADTNAMNSDVAMACRATGGTINNTWGTEVPMDIANMGGSSKIDKVTTNAITPDGTCTGGGKLLQFRWQLDQTGTTTAVATLHVVGFKLEYTATAGGD